MKAVADPALLRRGRWAISFARLCCGRLPAASLMLISRYIRLRA